MANEVSTSPHRHAAEWGLAALLLSMTVLILFPLMTALILVCDKMAWVEYGVESRHLDFGIAGGYAVVYGLLAMALFAVGCGSAGLVAAVRRGQPFALALAGKIAGVVAAGAAIVLLQIANYIAEDLRHLQKKRSQGQIEESRTYSSLITRR